MSTQHRQGRVVTDIIVGGAYQAYAMASNADVVMVIDSRDAIARLPELPRLIKIPLGEQDTVLSLLERLQDTLPDARDLLETYRQRNVHLASGMAQDPEIGKCVIQDLKRSGELDTIFDQLFKRILEASNGTLAFLVVRVLNSNAGSMGSGGGPEIGDLFCAYAAQRTTAKIRHQMIRLGGLTYTFVAERGHENTAIATKRNVDHILHNHIPPGQLRDLELYELPLRSEDGRAVRDDYALRARLAATLLQARFSTEVDGLLDRRRVNHIPTSPYGAMVRVQASWSEWLDQEQLTRAAATYYRDQLKAMHGAPDASDLLVALGADVQLEPLNAPLPGLEEVMAAVRKGDTQSPLLDQVRHAELRRMQSTVLLRTAQDQMAFLDEVLEHPERPRHLDDSRAYSRRWRGVVAHLTEAHQAAQAALTSAQRLFEQRQRHVTREIKHLRSFRSTLEAILRSRRGVVQRTHAVFAAYYEAHERYSAARALVAPAHPDRGRRRDGRGG